MADAAEVEEEEVDEVAALNREIADLKTKLSKANKGKKEEKDEEIQALKKEEARLKLELSVAEKKKKLGEIHPHESLVTMPRILLVAAVAILIFAVMAMGSNG